mmetsp:Transcript_1790/g.4901  ORF Transcript_1790/g.4901 Transcript_1790/m.4901 type:complete len:277 (-) Transcript_1790:181-1011(-)
MSVSGGMRHRTKVIKSHGFSENEVSTSAGASATRGLARGVTHRFHGRAPGPKVYRHDLTVLVVRVWIDLPSSTSEASSDSTSKSNRSGEIEAVDIDSPGYTSSHTNSAASCPSVDGSEALVSRGGTGTAADSVPKGLGATDIGVEEVVLVDGQESWLSEVFTGVQDSAHGEGRACSVRLTALAPISIGEGDAHVVCKVPGAAILSSIRCQDNLSVAAGHRIDLEVGDWVVTNNVVGTLGAGGSDECPGVRQDVSGVKESHGRSSETSGESIRLDES